jgi:hypothetical protein
LNVQELSDICREVINFNSPFPNGDVKGSCIYGLNFEKIALSHRKDDKLPKPNYQHDKRQRELEKKKKKEEKKQRKQTTEKPEEDAEPLSETVQSS